jgi:hypothetical protein
MLSFSPLLCHKGKRRRILKIESDVCREREVDSLHLAGTRGTTCMHVC